MCVRPALVDAVRRRGVITRREALTIGAAHVVDDALACGAIVRVFPGVYTLPDYRDDRRILRRGVQVYRPDCAISHVDGLDVWGLPTALDDTVHITLSPAKRVRPVPGLTPHHRHAFDPVPPQVMTRRGLRVVSLEQAVVESWPLLPEIDRRVPAIVALRERRTTGQRLLATLDRQPKTAGAAELRHVFALAAAGCHSPLEMWGHENVFSDPRLPESKCQVPFDLPTGRIYLDRLYLRELVNVELDGAAYHGEPGQRERDLRRDVQVATFGVLPVRFSHPRLHGDPLSAIDELLRILAVRRRQMGLDAA